MPCSAMLSIMEVVAVSGGLVQPSRIIVRTGYAAARPAEMPSVFSAFSCALRLMTSVSQAGRVKQPDVSGSRLLQYAPAPKKIARNSLR